MAELEEKDKPLVGVGKTPQGQFVSEAPEVTMPGIAHDLFGYLGQWLGNPRDRYGYLVSAWHIPTRIKLEMMRDEVLALCIAFAGTMLVKANREIRCTNEAKRRFFQAMFECFEHEFVLQANVGIALGSLGLVKKWRFAVPEFADPEEPPVWKSAATPYIITGFDPLYPETSSPRFDDRGRHFEGMSTPDGDVDVFHSLWLTFRKPFAFGRYTGVGRLDHCYKQWWLKNFTADLYVVAMQKQANRVVEMRYPPGIDPKSGKPNKQIALEIGDLVRGGATVAIPSDPYTTTGLDGEERASNLQRWSLAFLEGSGGFEQFHTMADHHDRKMSLGYFLPPQALLEVTGGQLGSVTSAEKLTDVAEALLMQDAADLDRHVNEYVFPAVSRANFPADSPKVVIETTGLAADNRAALLEIIKVLIGQDPATAYFDMRTAMERLEFPLKTEEQVEKEQAEAQKKAAAQQQQAAAQQAAAQPVEPDKAAKTAEPGKPTEPSKPAEPDKAAKAADVTEAGRVEVSGNPLAVWPDENVPLDAEDAKIAVAWWRDFAPAWARGLLDATTEDAAHV